MEKKISSANDILLNPCPPWNESNEMENPTTKKDLKKISFQINLEKI